MKKSEKISISGIILNSILFISKFIVGMTSGSIALISDAINSFTDIFASAIIFIAVRVSNKKADESHPFGHYRAEPIAGLIVAIFTGIVGFEIAKVAIINLFSEHSNSVGYAAVAVLLFSISVKSGMSYYYIRKGKSMKRPAIKAAGIDSRNDVFVSLVALIGVFGAIYGYHKLDDIAALIISIFIFYFGYQIGIENLDFLMGKTPSRTFIEKIKDATREVKGVKGINDVRAHYVGNRIHIEIHIEVGKNYLTKKSHDIGKEVQRKVEKFSEIGKAFIHIDPV